jgi:hypothetical protein
MSIKFNIGSPGDPRNSFEVRVLSGGYGSKRTFSFNLTPWPDDTLYMHSEFGREGCYIEATTRINASNAFPKLFNGQAALIRIRGCPETTAIVKSVTYECIGNDGDWRLIVIMEPVVFNAANQYDVIDYSLSGNNQLSPFEIVGRLLEEASGALYADDSMLKICTELDESDSSKHYMYDSVHWKYKCIGDAIDSICYESELEYYYELFPGMAIHAGWPAPPITPDATGRALTGVFTSINNGGRFAPMRYRGFLNGNKKDFEGITCVVSGSPVLCAGMIFNWPPLGIPLKIVCSDFYMSNEGEAETSLLAIDRMSPPLTTQLALDNYKDDLHAKELELNRKTPYGFRIADVKPCDKFYGEKATTATKVEEFQQNPVEWKPVEDTILFPNLVWASPFTGDGVGLLFPKQDANRRLIFFPEHEQDFGIVSDGIWRKDEVKEEVIPERNDDDFLLRLKDGFMYFDAENKEWYLKSPVVKMEGGDPGGADTKPDPTQTDGLWIEINSESNSHITVHFSDDKYAELSNDGVVMHFSSSNYVELTSGGAVIEASSIKLGSGASMATAKNGDDVNVAQAFLTWLNVHVHGSPGSPPVTPFVGPQIGDILATSTKVKNE